MNPNPWTYSAMCEFAASLDAQLKRCRVELHALLNAARHTHADPAGDAAMSWSTLVTALQAVCAGADEHCQTAEALVTGLRGNGATDGPSAPVVLVVDDSVDTRQMLLALLESAGLSALTAANGLEALLIAHTYRPAVIIMDLHMPVLDGLEATRLLKASPHTRASHVIAHTSSARASSMFTAHFTEVLRKPADPSVLLEQVRRLMPSDPAVGRDEATN